MTREQLRQLIRKVFGDTKPGEEWVSNETYDDYSRDIAEELWPIIEASERLTASLRRALFEAQWWRKRYEANRLGAFMAEGSRASANSKLADYMKRLDAELAAEKDALEAN